MQRILTLVSRGCTQCPRTRNMYKNCNRVAWIKVDRHVLSSWCLCALAFSFSIGQWHSIGPPFLSNACVMEEGVDDNTLRGGSIAEIAGAVWMWSVGDEGNSPGTNTWRTLLSVVRVWHDWHWSKETFWWNQKSSRRDHLVRVWHWYRQVLVLRHDHWHWSKEKLLTCCCTLRRWKMEVWRVLDLMTTSPLQFCLLRTIVAYYCVLFYSIFASTATTPVMYVHMHSSFRHPFYLSTPCTVYPTSGTLNPTIFIYFARPVSPKIAL